MKRRLIYILLILMTAVLFLSGTNLKTYKANNPPSSDPGLTKATFALAEKVLKSMKKTPSIESTIINDCGSGEKPFTGDFERNSFTGSAIPIVYYHSVKTVPNNPICMPPYQLEEQMKYLHEKQFRSVSLTELYNFLYGEGTLPAKPIVITFDDGYKDNYLNALPILKKYGFTATVFVTVSQNGSDFLTRDEMKELLGAGWDIESHTMTHPALNKLDPEKLKTELQKSKEMLELDLGREVKFLAYPYGKFNDAVLKATKEAGYEMAFTIHAEWASRDMNPLSVSRVYLYAGMGLKEFARRVENPLYHKKSENNPQNKT